MKRIIEKLKEKHASGHWSKFLLPRTIIDNKEVKIVRWLNFYPISKQK